MVEWTPPFELTGIRETCQQLRLSRPTVMRLIDDGVLTAYLVGERYRIDQRSVDHYAHERGAGKPAPKPVPEAKRQARRGGWPDPAEGNHPHGLAPERRRRL
jgi:excisionase family DNA binding protein